MASQRRHNRRRKTKGRFRALYQVLSILLILIAVTAGCIVFFRVNTITVEGNQKYTQEDIIAASGIQSGDFLAVLNTSRSARLLRTGLPYVEAVSIRRTLPDGVVIRVEECAVAAAVQSDGDWWLINSAGKLLENVSAAQAETHAELTGIELLAPEVGSTAVVAEEDSVRWSAALDFLATLDERGDLDKLDSLECGTPGTFTAQYDGRYTLLLPTAFSKEESSYGRLMSLLDEFYPTLEEGDQTVVDFTLWEDTGKIFNRRSV